MIIFLVQVVVGNLVILQIATPVREQAAVPDTVVVKIYERGFIYVLNCKQ